MPKDEKEELEEQVKQPKPKKGMAVKSILFIIIGGLIACGIGAGGYYFLSHSKAKTTEKKPEVVTIWPMEPFIVNIADASGERYLKIVIQLEVSGSEVVAELEQIKPRLRDTILDLLAPKNLKELMDVTGKQRLREDIAGRVNNVITQGKVSRVYFTEFVVQ